LQEMSDERSERKSVIEVGVQKLCAEVFRGLWISATTRFADIRELTSRAQATRRQIIAPIRAALPRRPTASRFAR
jgi:hypothetical protein